MTTTAVLTGLLSVISTIALGMGAWFFKNLSQAVSELRKEIGHLRENLATLNAKQDHCQDFRVELRDVESRLRALEAHK